MPKAIADPLGVCWSYWVWSRRSSGKTPAVREINIWGPRPDSRSHVQYIYLLEALCPGSQMSCAARRKIQPSSLPGLLAKRQTYSLRTLAEEYAVSHETIRQELRRVGVQRV